MKAEWRKHTESFREQTESLRIPGGWLWRTTMYDTGSGQPVATAIAFQPERAE